MVPIPLRSIDTFTQALQSLLQQAGQHRTEDGIGQPLDEHIFGDRVVRIGQNTGAKVTPTIQAQYAAIETAARNILYDLIATTSITDSSFSQVWDLLDIVNLISDADGCEPGLAFWLVEELLDTQTIDGCRIIFDYLESRRERMCAKRLSKKSLIILRACNELLRRLSRAEDTVFCGRIFIYLFQSFPLGDRSSVNLRGEYHTENVTNFDSLETDPGQMEHLLMNVDEPTGRSGTHAPQPVDDSTEERSKSAVTEDRIPATPPKAGALNDEAGATQDTNKFYLDFWSLQQNFAMPTRLFEDEQFASFKAGLTSTMDRFKTVNQNVQRRLVSSPRDDSKQGTKRKRGEQDEELSASFNPKYLTSQDLFELEISDLAFRRHILVQALILIDFLLSLTPKAKKKLAGKGNKSVLYSYTLSDDNAQWATQTRSDIATYLQQGPEGKFYYRMVDTVLSRDKNWAQWKADSCPNMQRDPVSAEDFLEARKGVSRACATRRLKANPLGSVNLDFLAEAANMDGLKKLTDPERYSIPSIDSFKVGIIEDDFDLEMAKDEDEKQRLKDAKASKIWRTLRVASRNKFRLFSQLEDGSNPDVLFETQALDSQKNVTMNGAETLEKDATNPTPEQPSVTDSLLEIPQ